MAEGPAVNLVVLVIDTSYLTELYQVPSYSSSEGHKQVRAKFDRATESQVRFYVPYPVIFEVANHIAKGRDDGARTALAKRFVDEMLKSFESSKPFIITPAIRDEQLKELLRVFAGEMVRERVGLTDASIVHEAKRLKKLYSTQARVHIWTKDRALKAREPDPEPGPFVVR